MSRGRHPVPSLRVGLRHIAKRWRPAGGAVLALLLAACQAPLRPQPAAPMEPAETAPSVPAPAPSAAPTPPPSPPPPPPDLFERLRASLGSSHCEGSQQQAQWVRLYAPQPARFGSRIESMLPLLDYVLGQIEAAGLPGEFALIPIIESTYRPQARSAQGPAGMWQFTADTARHFGLQVSAERDERYSVVDATEAALDFLGDLHADHGDWALAAAGYNAGAFRLRKLLERLEAPPPPGQLPQGLARGTYEYVEKLKAWACMLSEPERFGIELPDPQGFEPLARVAAPRRLQRLDLLSEASGVPADTLRSLNPLLRPNTPARGDSELLLPENAAAELLAFVDRVQSGAIPLPEPRVYTVVAGDTLSTIARRHGVRVAELQQWNKLSAKWVLRIGQQLHLEAPPQAR
ncbi:transglycosylase SLT domain-containing protein [uncultured Aquimonas sp.]|uniref:transglycosylase SLT domain-containing protein n=1 Tax=uncultured Aquimonas sp. TaxID=385483 RepID=UPI0026057E83|nr:transglycosylase SLT domain-containing protein [uncultured Aquimonas sp.]